MCAPLWYNKALLEEAGAKVPTNWDELLTAGQALKKIGVFGYAIGTGAGNNLGAHSMVAMMIKNGGGLFNADGKPDCVTDGNIEAMEFVQQLASEGIIDKAAVSYTTDNLDTQWNTKKAALGIHTPGLADQRRRRSPTTWWSAAPLPVPERHQGRAVLREQHHDVHQHPVAGGVGGVPDLLLREDPPVLGDPGWPGGVPVLKSITGVGRVHQGPQPGQDRQGVDTGLQDLRGHGTKAFAALASVDGGQALTQFAQTMLQGKTDSKEALTTLQHGLEAVVK